VGWVGPGPPATLAGVSERLAYIHLPDSAGVELRPGQRMVIGRAEGCHIRIESSKISRKHAELHWAQDKDVPFVVDMGSQNGTRVDDTDLRGYHPHPLKDGSSIRVANFRLRVELFLPQESYLNESPTGVSVFWDNNDAKIQGTLGVDVALREVFKTIEGKRLSGTLIFDHDGKQTRAVFCLGRLFDAKSPDASGTEAILALRRASGATVSFTPEFEPTSRSFDLSALDVLAGRGAFRQRGSDEQQTERWNPVE